MVAHENAEEETTIMKKSVMVMVAALGLMAMVSGCSGQAAGNTAAETAETTGKAADTTAVEADADTSADTKAPEAEASEAGAAGGTFTVGFDQEFPPMGFVGDDGEYTGFDLEVAKEVAERLGLEFVPQPVDWAAKDMELESGNIDCIWNGFTMTGREDDYTWSEAYMANQQVFVVTAGFPAASAPPEPGPRSDPAFSPAPNRLSMPPSSAPAHNGSPRFPSDYTSEACSGQLRRKEWRKNNEEF